MRIKIQGRPVCPRIGATSDLVDVISFVGIKIPTLEMSFELFHLMIRNEIPCITDSFNHNCMKTSF